MGLLPSPTPRAMEICQYLIEATGEEGYLLHIPRLQSFLTWNMVYPQVGLSQKVTGSPCQTMSMSRLAPQFHGYYHISGEEVAVLFPWTSNGKLRLGRGVGLPRVSQS